MKIVRYHHFAYVIYLFLDFFVCCRFVDILNAIFDSFFKL